VAFIRSHQGLQCRPLLKFGSLIPKRLTGLALALAACFSSSDLLADQPAVSRVLPSGFVRGQEVEMEINGARIGDAHKLLTYLPGIEQLSVAAEGDNKCKFKLKIAADCQPGLHSLRLATRTGVSNVVYFGIGTMPVVNEVEPNSEFATPQSVSHNSTIHGVCQNEDVDYYAIDLAEGQKLTVELEGLRLGTEFFDPFVAILDANRFELARSDDATLIQQDCVCSFTAQKAGKYIVEVRESSFGGSGNAFYRLHVGDYPRPLSIIPSGGKPGELIQATLIDASGQSWTEAIQLPSVPGEFAYTASKDGKFSPSPNILRVADLPNYSETAGDETSRDAIAAVDLPASFNGVLEKEGDVDWFKFKAAKDQTIEFNVFARRALRSPVDSVFEVFNAAGGRLALNDDNNNKPDSYLSFKIPADGEYLISVRDQLGKGSPFHAYRIEASPPKPSLELDIDELQRYISQTMEIPQGGQMAVILRAKRANFGGPLNLRIDGAPAGLELLTPTFTANDGFIPLMIRAAKDAPIGATLTDMIAETPADAQPKVSGTLAQRTMLVRGQNNIDVWGHDTTRLALAVTEELPYTISVDQPQVPLTRLGNSELVVRAVRKEGYKDAIPLRVLYNPNGVSANGSIAIAEGQSEAKIPITANGQAAIGTFPITVLAHAKSKNAAVWCATEFIKLDVQDVFFDFKFPKAVITQGESGFVVIEVDSKRPPEGTVELELVGIPAGVTAPQPKVAWTEGTAQVSFPVSISADARAAQHKTLVIKATITRPNGQIFHTQGTGELQIVPPPPKPAAEVVAAAPPPPAAPAPVAAAPPKPLSRLEQLRQAQNASKGSQ
jgi:Bacterial pre-peptidase C-terminal domain